jgi:hypothetical protein
MGSKIVAWMYGAPGLLGLGQKVKLWVFSFTYVGKRRKRKLLFFFFNPRYFWQKYTLFG